MVGTDGGNVQADIWKLTAAMELLNLTSCFLDNLRGGGANKKKASMSAYNILLL
jgi:hypothetical protein